MEKETDKNQRHSNENETNGRKYEIGEKAVM